MTKDIVKVPVRGMTAEEVLTLWLQGELYTKKKELTREELHQRCISEALAYVSAIDEYATEVWRPQLRQLWQAVVCDEMFTNALVMKKGRQRGLLNRYVMTAIVFYLQALDIYQNVIQIELHRRLENVNDRNSVYKGACKYQLSFDQKRRIRELKDFLASRK